MRFGAHRRKSSSTSPPSAETQRPALVGAGRAGLRIESSTTELRWRPPNLAACCSTRYSTASATMAHLAEVAVHLPRARLRPASRRRSMGAVGDSRRVAHGEAARLMATYALNSAVLFHIARAACDRQSSADTIVATVFAALGLEGFVNETLECSKFSATRRSRMAIERARHSRARLWQLRGKRAQARDLLAPVYGSFTEGFDIAEAVSGLRQL